MKNKVKLLAVLATFALSAPVLAACGGKPTPSKDPDTVVSAPDGSSQIVDPSSSAESSSSAIPPVKRFYLNPDAPEDLVEGEVYNLEDFVILEGGAGPTAFTVESKTPDTAWVDGHTLEIIGSGDVSLLFSAANNKEVRYTGVAMSALAAEYKEAISEVTNCYTLSQYGEDDQGNEVVVPWMIHNPRYVYMYGDIWQSSVAEFNEQCPGHTVDQCLGCGLIELENGNVYGFNLYDDGDIDVFDKLGRGLSNYIIALDYNLPASVLTTVYSYKDPKTGKKHDALKLSRNDNTFDFDEQESLFYTNLMTTMTMSGVKYTPHTVWLYSVTDATSGKTVWNMDMQMAKASNKNVAVNQYSYWQLNFDQDDSVIEEVDALIDSGFLPDAVPFDDIPTAFDALIDAKNYTLTTTVTVSTSSSDKSQTTDKYDQSGYANGDVAVTKVENDKVYSTFNGEFWRGGLEIEGAPYVIYSAEEGETPTPEPLTAFESIWDSPMVVGNLGTGSTVYNTFEASARTVAADGTVTLKVDAIDSPNFCTLFYTQDRPLSVLRSYKEQITDDDLYKYLHGTFEIKGNSIHVEYYMGWRAEDNSTYYVFYDSVYSNVGTTTVTELDQYLPG